MLLHHLARSQRFSLTCAAALCALLGPPQLFSQGVAYVSDRGGDYDIIVTSADGATTVNLTQGNGFNYEPQVSPNGSKIAFESMRDGDSEVYVMNADGSSQTDLTNSPSTTDWFPRWSPNGTKIAFERYDDGTGTSHIWVINAAGGGAMDLTPETAYAYDARWSPDGSKLLFTSTDDGPDDIWVVNADGTSIMNLTQGASTDFQGRWSPNGAKILFTSYRDGDGEVYVMNADGTSQTDLTNDPGDDGNAWWSPSGAKILFESLRGDFSNVELYVMNADGTNPTNLTQTASMDEFNPQWSSNGSKIAYEAVGNAAFEVYTMNSADGSAQFNVSNNDADDFLPVWASAPEPGPGPEPDPGASADEQIEALISMIEQLVDDGIIRARNAKSLTQILKNALKSIVKNNDGAACNQVSAFINSVEGKTPGMIPADVADELINLATQAQESLGCFAQ